MVQLMFHYNIKFSKNTKETNKLQMDRDIKVFNRPIMDKIHKKNQEMHMQRLKNIKNGISNRTMPANSLNISKNKKLSNKKAYLQEQEKNLQIQKQNVILFNKMMKIMHRPDPHQPVNYENRTMYNSRQRFQSQANRTEMQNSKITEQNRNIFNRLQKQKPTISTQKLKQQRMKNLNILRFLGKYPNNKAISAHRMSYDYSTNGNSRATKQSQQFQQPDKHQERKKKLNTTLYFKYHNKQYENENQANMFEHEINNETGQLDEEMYDAQMRKYQDEIKRIKQRDNRTSYNRRKFMSQSINRRQPNIDSEQSQVDQKIPDLPKMDQFQRNQPQKMYKQKQSFGLQQKNTTQKSNSHQISLYEGKNEINGFLADIKFTRTFNSYMIRAKLSRNIVNMKQSYEVQIPEKDGNQFFSQFNYDYRMIANLLILEDGQLVIDTQKSKNIGNNQTKNIQQIQNAPVEPHTNPKQIQQQQNEDEPQIPGKKSINPKLQSARYQQDLDVSIQ